MPFAGSMDNVCMRTLLFFVDNPEEALSTADVRAKFGVRIRHLARVLRPLVAGGYLAYTPGRGQRVGVFVAGPKLRALGVACTAQQA